MPAGRNRFAPAPMKPHPLRSCLRRCRHAAWLLFLPAAIFAADEPLPGSIQDPGAGAPTEAAPSASDAPAPAPDAPAAGTEGAADSGSAASPVSVDEIINRARQYLGDEEVLNGIQSLHFTGTITDHEGKSHAIDIIVRRPMQQLITESTPEARVVTALDDYDAWRREGPSDRPQAGRIMLLGPQEIRRLRASTWQVLYYYRDIEAVGGSVTVEGEEEIDGLTCVRTVFSHPGGVRFERFFDRATGRLVLTRVDDGSELRENGELRVDGIRFPKELTTTFEGKTSRVVFTSVQVNEEFPDSMFRIPTPRIDFGLPPTAAPGADGETDNDPAAPELPSSPDAPPGAEPPPGPEQPSLPELPEEPISPGIPPMPLPDSPAPGPNLPAPEKDGPTL